MVVLLVMSLIATLGVKGFKAITKSDLRSATSHLSGGIRFLFDRASITGKYHRLVIDLTDGRYWAEVSDDRFYAPNQAESAADRQKREEDEAAADDEDRQRSQKREQASSDTSLSQSSSFDAAKLDVNVFRPKHARFAAFKETALKPVVLKRLRIRSVYTPRMTEPVTSGRAYLYFYPLGQTEPAIVTLSDESGDSVYSLVVHPITGRVRIYNQEVRPPVGRQYDDQGNEVVR